MLQQFFLNYFCLRKSELVMTYSIIYEKISDPSFEEGYYYAHLPALFLMTHGFGFEGAKAAASGLLSKLIFHNVF